MLSANHEMTFIWLGITKLQCQKLNIIEYFLFSLICLCMICSKEKQAKKKKKAKRIKMLLYVVASMFLGDVRVIGRTSMVIVPHQAVMIVCDLNWFSHISTCYNMRLSCNLAMFFPHYMQILCYFWYMCMYNVIWPSQGIHVLMYTY